MAQLVRENALVRVLEASRVRLCNWYRKKHGFQGIDVFIMTREYAISAASNHEFAILELSVHFLI